MRNWVSKAIVVGVTALAVGAATVGATEPAAAAGGVVWHGGWGGWHGGWRGPAVAGWYGGRYWHPGYWNGGVWYNGWWGPAVAAGVIAGSALAIAAANSAPYYGPYYGYGNPCIQVRPLYAPNGAWIGNGPVNVCQ